MDNIESLIPDFMMEAGRFYLVIMDVDGRIIKFNMNFQKIFPDPKYDQFEKFLSPTQRLSFPILWN